MSRLVRAACAVPVLIALAGCGGGAATAPAALPDVTPTKARAVAAARAINLTIDDLPLFTRDRDTKKTPESAALDRRFSRCIGIPVGNLQTVAEVDASFSHDFRMVASDVDVVKTLSAAKRDVAAIRKPGAGACVAEVLGTVLERSMDGQGSVSTPSVRTFTPNPAYGASEAFGFEITATVRLPQGQLPVHLAFMGFAVKHTEVSLMVISPGRPFPADQRDGLFITLVQTAKAKAV